MAENDWFNAVDHPSTAKDNTAPGAHKMPDNDAREGPKKNTHVTATVVASLGVVMGLASAIAYLTDTSNDTNQQAQATAETAALTTTRVAPMQDKILLDDPETAIGVAGQCRPQDGEAQVSAEEDTVRGAVARWQSAYYQQDAETLRNSIAPDSRLLDNAWPAILAEAAPAGTTWCAVMSPTSDTTVDVDVMVTLPDGDATTYPQTVTGQQQPDGTWTIYDIETREG